jgi:hypothetical protein
MTSNSVTGDGVPLTTAQRVARYGARTRPTLTGGLPLIELDDAQEGKYRESVLLGYEDIDRQAALLLRNRRWWLWLAGIGAAALLYAGVTFTLGGFAVSTLLSWAVPAALPVIAAWPYRRIDAGKHEKLLETAREYIAPFVDAGKARYVDA